MSGELAEVAVTWQDSPRGRRVTASLGDSKITVKHPLTERGGDEAVTLVNSLPGIMNAVLEGAAEQEEA